MSTQTTTTEAASGAEGFAQIPASMLEQAHQHAVDLAQCALFVDAKALAKAMTDASAFLRQVALFQATAPQPAGAERVDLGELERLSEAATQGLSTVHEGQPDDHGPDASGGFTFCLGKTRRTGGGRVIHKFGFAEDIYRDHNPDEWAEAEATIKLLSGLWNAYRSGQLVPASLPAALGSGEGTAGAPPAGSGWSAEPEPVPVSALTGAHPSRGEVDYEDLNRLFALMPEGPWHPLRTGDSHEIRQIDTDPTNKHHWPFRLCQSIAGQRAACDDAVFAFIAGVLNAWPAIAEANSDDAYIDRVLAMPEDELRKRFLVDGQSPEQAETISRQAFDLAVLKVALTQIHDQYIINRGDMTDAEALTAIERIAAKALGIEARQGRDEGSACESPAPSGATPHPQSPSLSEVEEAKAVLEGLDPRRTPQQHIASFRKASLGMTRVENIDKCLAKADAIEAALATLTASQERDGGDR